MVKPGNVIIFYLHVPSDKAMEFARYFSRMVESEFRHKVIIVEDEHGKVRVEINLRHGNLRDKEEEYVGSLYEKCRDIFFGSKMDVSFMS